jgi:hypothetical protein
VNNRFSISFGVLVNIVTSTILILLSCFLPNKYLSLNSYILYGIQFFLMIPYLLWKIKYVKNLFLPSFFVLVYYSINLFLGSYLSPRGFGFVKWFIHDLLISKYYNIITTYFLACNLALFLLCYSSLKKLNQKYANIYPQKVEGVKPDFFIDTLSLILTISFYFLISFLNIDSLFSFQLAIIVIYTSYVSYHRKWFRYLVYLVFLFGMVLYNFENKREVVIVLFFLIFIEAYHSQWILRFSLKRLFLYSAIGAVFIGLILTSSILRGYGNYKPKSVTEAVSDIPKYIRSSIFINGLSENLELNYSYSTAVTSMDMILKGGIKYQYGLTIIKVLFLPVPRTLFPYKPMSSLQLYTKNYTPDYWKNGGSLPVIFQCDMFMNFNFLGLIPFVLILLIIDSFFIKFHFIDKRNFSYFAYPLLFITVLILARGSGLEQYILYFLISLPVILLYVFFKDKLILLSKKLKNRYKKL